MNYFCHKEASQTARIPVTAQRNVTHNSKNQALNYAYLV